MPSEHPSQHHEIRTSPKCLRYVPGAGAAPIAHHKAIETGKGRRQRRRGNVRRTAALITYHQTALRLVREKDQQQEGEENERSKEGGRAREESGRT